MTNPTQETRQHDKGEMRCPGCGKPEDEWQDPRGFSLGGEVYCCQGCAEGTGCTCDPNRHDREL